MKIVKNEENLSQKIVFKLLKYNRYKDLQCFMLLYGKKDENHIPRDLLRIGQRGLYKTKLPRKRKNNRNSSKYNNLSERNELIQRLKMRIKSSCYRYRHCRHCRRRCYCRYPRRPRHSR